MEPLFEMRYYANQKTLTEFYQMHGTGPRIPMLVIMALVFVFFVLRSIWWGIFLEMVPMLLFMALMFTLIGFMPDWFTWNLLRQVKKQNDGQIPETVVTLGDCIELHEGLVHYTIEYRKIVKVVSLKHSYVLMMGKRNGIILNPQGFTKGTFSEFKEFLRQKRPDLKIPE